MFKLLTQVLCITVIWILVQVFSINWGWGIGLSFVSIILVHHLWENFVFQPYAYLGSMPVAVNDPLILEAELRSKETLQKFLVDLYPKYMKDSMVKVPYVNSKGDIEKLWGDLVALKGNAASIYIRTPPNFPRDDFSFELEISINDIVDWSVELEDGTLRGGFSNQALFKIFERQEGYMHPQFQKHVLRFNDKL